MDIYEKLKKLNIELPPPPPRGGQYVPVKQVSNILYTSGVGPLVNGESPFKGLLGKELTEEDGKEAARLAIINLLSLVHHYWGDLNKIKNVVKVLAFVASNNGFDRQPAIINAASEILISVFGEKGKHTRSAIGTNQLPGNIPVEIEVIFEI